MTPFIKVCCMASVDEAEMAMRAGASAIGLVSAMPSGAGNLATWWTRSCSIPETRRWR